MFKVVAHTHRRHMRRVARTAGQRSRTADGRTATIRPSVLAVRSARNTQKEQHDFINQTSRLINS